jgi:hypothetical protein
MVRRPRSCPHEAVISDVITDVKRFGIEYLPQPGLCRLNNISPQQTWSFHVSPVVGHPDTTMAHISDRDRNAGLSSIKLDALFTSERLHKSPGHDLSNRSGSGYFFVNTQYRKVFLARLTAGDSDEAAGLQTVFG